MKKLIGKCVLALSAWAAAVSLAVAAPGAHGPNGEHLDAPAGSAAPSAAAAPRFEARSDLFELVGRLSGGELSMFINRYETSEPLERAQVEVELGSRKAVAAFHGDQGDYAVADEAFIKALSAPGEHAVVVTVIAGDTSDLLEGRLQVADPAANGDDHGHGHDHDGGWVQPRFLAAGGAVLLALVVTALTLRRRGRTRRSMAGGVQ
jgi:hypothetical protein